MTETRVEVEPGVALNVLDVGSGRPVVLLAGFGLDHEVWDGQVAALGASHRVVAIDLRGTGRSDKPLPDSTMSCYTMARLATDVAIVLDRLDLTAVTVVGHSFGGQIALQLAASAPPRLAQVVLVSSNGVRASRSPDFPFGPPADKLEAALVRAEQERRPASRRANVRSGFLGDPDPDLVDWLVAAQLRMPSWAAIACYHTYLHTDLTAELASVKVPVLQVLGAEDPVTVAAGAGWVQERLADGRLVVLDGCGHYPMFEARDRFLAVLVEFLSQT